MPKSDSLTKHSELRQSYILQFVVQVCDSQINEVCDVKVLTYTLQITRRKMCSINQENNFLPDIENVHYYERDI
jgi:hypothetical protein